MDALISRVEIGERCPLCGEHRGSGEQDCHGHLAEEWAEHDVANIRPYQFQKLPEARFENAVVERVTVGSMAHDGRAFLTVYFAGGAWGQGCNPAWDREAVDRLIAVCGASDLFGCKGKHVRVGRVGGYGALIAAVAPIVSEEPMLVVRPDDVLQALEATAPRSPQP